MGSAHVELSLSPRKVSPGDSFRRGQSLCVTPEKSDDTMNTIVVLTGKTLAVSDGFFGVRRKSVPDCPFVPASVPTVAIG